MSDMYEWEGGRSFEASHSMRLPMSASSFDAYPLRVATVALILALFGLVPIVRPGS